MLHKLNGETSSSCVLGYSTLIFYPWMCEKRAFAVDALQATPTVAIQDFCVAWSHLCMKESTQLRIWSYGFHDVHIRGASPRELKSTFPVMCTI